MFGVPDRWLTRYFLLKTEAFDSFSIEEGIVSLPLTCMLLTTWHRRLTDSFSSLTCRSHSYSREAVGFNTHLCCSHTIWRKVRRKTQCDGGKIRFLFLPLHRSKLSVTSSGATFARGKCFQNLAGAPLPLEPSSITLSPSAFSGAESYVFVGRLSLCFFFFFFCEVVLFIMSCESFQAIHNGAI